MNLVVAATSKVALPAIEYLQELGHELTIATMPDRPAGRGLKLQPSEIAQRFPEAVRVHAESDLQNLIEGSDLLLTIAFGRILDIETLNIPKFGSINLHFSLLPRWRGAAPVQRAIEAGDRQTGVTVFQMDSGMDTGPIWVQKTFEIPEGYNSLQLFDSLSELGKFAIAESLDLINAGQLPQPQTGSISTAGKISKQECQLDWKLSAEVLLRKIKAFSPTPGAFTYARGEILKILDAQLTNESLPPGSINNQGFIGTSTCALALLKVKPSGKREMLVSDWVNGFKPVVGEVFE